MKKSILAAVAGTALIVSGTAAIAAGAAGEFGNNCAWGLTQGVKKYTDCSVHEKIDGKTAAELGGEPILHMRAFQKTGELPPALVEDILARAAAS